jgi:hypothetical protein
VVGVLSMRGMDPDGWLSAFAAALNDPGGPTAP